MRQLHEKLSSFVIEKLSSFVDHSVAKHTCDSGCS